MPHMLSKYISRKDLPAFAFIAAAGTLNHFLYQWTGSAFVAFFCPVNESVWEHLKLLFFPFLFYSLWNYMCKKPNAASYFFYRFLAVLCGMLCIITFFYTYTGIIGRNFLILDIITFLLAIMAALHFIPHLARAFPSIPSLTATYTAWMSVVLCFFMFTCFPPEIPLFISYA
ncbi:DUF6512 family protein [Lachnospiraceae bacterium 42-17]|nr:hypothetical protein [Dorea sp.]